LKGNGDETKDDEEGELVEDVIEEKMGHLLRGEGKLPPP
jgi:hypothetical protein